MTKSQNTKNEQLTEQWKKWQLEAFRWYYVKFKTGEIDICWYTEWSNDELGTGGQYFDGVEDENITEVLAPVPSYEELQNMNEAVNKCMAANIKLVEQNKQLKELLKECKEPLEVFADKKDACEWCPEDLLAKIDEVLK